MLAQPRFANHERKGKQPGLRALVDKFPNSECYAQVIVDADKGLASRGHVRPDTNRDAQSNVADTIAK